MVGATVIIFLLLFPFVLAMEGAFNANHELLEAAKEGKASRIKFVLEQGAYIEARNNNGVRLCNFLFSS